jgi:hypothetical protein
MAKRVVSARLLSGKVQQPNVNPSCFTRTKLSSRGALSWLACSPLTAWLWLTLFCPPPPPQTRKACKTIQQISIKDNKCFNLQKARRAHVSHSTAFLCVFSGETTSINACRLNAQLLFCGPSITTMQTNSEVHLGKTLRKLLQLSTK